MATRPAGKAGSWYTGHVAALERQLNGFLALVPETINDSPLPIPGARVIIAPHAGYDYSGECAAWAYSCLDLSEAKRVFILGPSHTYYLEGCAVTTFAKYATPYGDLTVDQDTIQRVKEAGEMEDIPRAKDSDEHSLEMHLPYLYKRCKNAFASPEDFPTIVPILIGDNNKGEEKSVGRILLSYLKDPENAFIISSDFCHWGHHFRYMVYSAENDPTKLTTLGRFDAAPAGPPIHETIRLLDEAATDAVKSGKHDAFVDNLKQTRNTVCGRHPIGVAMAALELLAEEANDETKYRFNIISYKRSNLVQKPIESSVSYVSAYAVL
ncbi:Protein MEMO1 [Tolypocladium ophioglossoides CBS 100239]|uniref:Protein MEMO1 n=1 Tax=Tolypocladium ophioglossoides (strain CBS 100239) TaxID=1163406 RepID=A0A0L0NAR3_TOLOC|nr:Protein MEMO1 [Tolypocladium ophioglossoides CBS 100239]